MAYIALLRGRVTLPTVPYLHGPFSPNEEDVTPLWGAVATPCDVDVRTTVGRGTPQTLLFAVHAA